MLALNWWEEGGIGGLIVAVLWAAVEWLKSKRNQAKK